MAVTTKFKPMFVDIIPEKLERGILYISMKYSVAVHLCACGCGEIIATPLAPKMWHLSFDGETVSLSPSIGNWDYDCKSHYFIVDNKVRWCYEGSCSKPTKRKWRNMFKKRKK